MDKIQDNLNEIIEKAEGLNIIYKSIIIANIIDIANQTKMLYKNEWNHIKKSDNGEPRKRFMAVDGEIKFM